jgi:hypothetical protein
MQRLKEFLIETGKAALADGKVTDSALSLIRHSMTFGGGFFVGKGWLSGELAVALTALAVAVIGIGWGVAQKFWAK